MIFGADFSTLEEVERLGGKFYDGGHEVDLIEDLAAHGIRSARLRLWIDPYGPGGEPYLGGTCDFDCVRRLAERSREAGMSFLLDLHYSDFWCDPGRQMIPKKWQGMPMMKMADALYDYTARTLECFAGAGLEPECTQVGNEITNGMLWPVAALGETRSGEAYDALAVFLDAGTRAVREASGSRTMLHLERSGDMALWKEWLDAVIGRGVLFDEIGASYYPYWHGGFDALKRNLDQCAAVYGKDIRIVETSYAFTGEHYNPAGNAISLCMTDHNRCCDGTEMPFPATPEGQTAYLRKLIALASEVYHGKLTGIYWWEPGWLPVKGSGWASKASLEYCHEEGKSTGNEWANQCLYDYRGNALPALEEFHA